MTVEKFNALSIEEKGTWITKQLRGQDSGVANTLIFRDKLIVFFCTTNAECLAADAYPWPEGRPGAVQMILGERHCLNVIQDNTPMIKEILERLGG